MFESLDKSSVLPGSTPGQAMPADQKVQHDSDPGLKKDDHQPGQRRGRPSFMNHNKKSDDTNNPLGNIENAGKGYHERIPSKTITDFADRSERLL
jgi:hypothetical protein